MTRRFGFTLAEVLITLGIIGVVAAMTMPTLINQTNGAQYKAAYKKALSAIAQGVTLNVALDDVSFADVVAGTAGKTDAPSAGTSVASLLNSRMNVVKAATADTALGYTIKAENGYTAADTNTALFFNDSSVFIFTDSNATGCTEASPCKGVIDVNGAKGPNKVIENVDNPANITDVYPVKYYDQTILPNSKGASAVLFGK